MSRAEVLSNTDLTRAIVSQASRPVTLLQTSRSIRHADPCAEYFEMWHGSGCPQHAAGAEAECLNAIGGLDGDFCTGTYDVDADGRRRTGVSAASVVRSVTRYLAAPKRGTVVITLGMGPTVLRVQASDSSLLISVIEDGWRKKGSRCTLSRAQAAELLSQILTRTGTVPLPCPAGTSVPQSVHVTRKLSVSVRLVEPARVLMSAART
jgi:hypothetical protein